MYSRIEYFTIIYKCLFQITDLVHYCVKPFIMMTRSMMMFKEFKDTASNDDDQRKEGHVLGLVKKWIVTKEVNIIQFDRLL